jgi:E3 Ubiquitin ligase
MGSMLLLATFVTRSSGSFPWFWPVAGACAGVYLFYHGFCLLQRKRLIMDTPSSKIRSAAMGLVEVSGLATGPYTVTAPITGKACYYYRTMVWQWKRQGRSSSWVKEADESLHVPFFLEDNTGRLLVNPQGAEMDIHRDFQDEFGSNVFSSSLEIPSNITNFLLMHGISTDKKIKVEEYCVKPKNALFVLGTLASNPGVEVSAVPVRSSSASEHRVSFNLGSGLSFSGFKDDAAAPPRPGKILDPAQQAKVAEALTKAGITNPAAWAAAGIQRPAPLAMTGGGASAAAAPAPEQFDVHPLTVLMKGEHNPAFFISWRSQRDVVQSLGWKSALMIWGGPALTLLCVYILAAR